MNVVRIIGLALCLSWCVVAAAAATDASPHSTLHITEMAVTTKIVRGNPIDSVHRISASSVKALYCFTRISRTDDSETTITHVWYHNGKVVGETALPVKGMLWRTYSKRPVDATSKGSWRVETLSSDKQVLKTVEFRIN